MQRAILRSLLVLLLLLLAASGAHAQVAKVVATCGVPGGPLSVGATYLLFIDTTGTLCTSAGGGSGGGTVTQGPAGASSSAWYVQPGAGGFPISNIPTGISATGSSLNVNITGGATGGGSSFGSAFPSTGQAIGVKNGLNMVNLTADGSSNLNVNCVVGCAGGATSNASSGVATSSTNGATVAWNYGFNGTTWDQLQVDASKQLLVDSNITNLTKINGSAIVTAAAGIMRVGMADGTGNALSSSTGSLNVNVTGGVATGSNFGAAFPATGQAVGAKNGANMVNLTADGSNNLNVNCAVGCAGGTLSNASSGVATSSTNGASISWNYGFNGTTWDQLQVDSSKNLLVSAIDNITKIAGNNVATAASGIMKVGITDSTGGSISTTSGSLNVNVTGGAAGGTASSFGTTFPSIGTAIGVKSGANMVNLTADGSNNLNINCVVGCAGGTTSNASSGVATSSTNGQTVAWIYGFNGTTWDQLQADGSKNLKVNSTVTNLTAVNGNAIATAASGIVKVGVTDGTGNALSSTTGSLNVNVTGGAATGSSFGAAFPATGQAIGAKNGANMVNLTADGSSNLNVNCVVGCSAGTTSNASSGVATSSTNGANVAWNYGFNGTTWDQLQVDGSKNLKVVAIQGAAGSSGSAWYVQPGTGGFGISNLPPSLAATGTSLNVNITGGVAPGSTFGTTFPTIGTAIGAKNGANMVNLAADASSNLNVNCQAGCAGGSQSNASSGVATSSTNGQQVAWNYGFNGTSWDQLQVDGSKQLLINSNVTNLTKINGNAIATAASGIMKVGLTDAAGNGINSTSNALNENCTNCLVTPTDEGTHTPGTSGFLNVGGFFQTTATSNPLTTGQFGTFQSTANRALMVNLRDASANEWGTTGNPLNVQTAIPPGSSGCAGQTVANTFTAPINLASTTTLKVITKVAAKNVYICAINIGPVAAAVNLALIEGTQTTNQCDTAAAGMAGGTTAATGWNIAANSGLTFGMGEGIIAKTATVNHDVCLIASGSTQISGVITWAQF